MPVVDADAHVVETEHTWDYMDPSERRFRPLLVTPGGESKGQYWFIDGKVRGFARSVITAREFSEMSRRANRRMDTPEEAREMENVEVRLQDMDSLGIDIQILYPSIFIEQVTDKPEIDVAICKGYNRWMAEVHRQGHGRLRWLCALPLLSIPDALDMLPWCKENGAVGVVMRGVEGSRLLPDPYFYPVYEAAERHNMAIGIHVGNANPAETDLLGWRNFSSGFWKFRLPVLGSFHAIVFSGLPALFPRLRFAFVEASAQWVPYLLRDLKRRLPANGRPWPEDPMKTWNLYVTCQMEDDIPYVLRETSEDHIVIGTDYGHNDSSTEIEVHRELRERGGVTETQYRKIVEHNPTALYGLA